MFLDFSQLFFFLEALILVSVIFMHLSKKNSSVISLYAAQSLIVVFFLLSSAYKNLSLSLAIVTLAVFAVKVIFAPYFFRRLTKKRQIKFAVSTYLNGPLTLIVIAAITALTHTNIFQPLASLSAENSSALLAAVTAMLISVFLIINRKGALSQMIGILSLENAIVSFAFLAGLEQTPGPQFGLIFDILVWVIIATVFASMIYQQFGSLDVTAMQHLKE